MLLCLTILKSGYGWTRRATVPILKLLAAKNGLGKITARLLLLSLPMAAAWPEDQPTAANAISKAITGIISSKQHAYLTPSDFTHRQEDLDTLYQHNNYQLLWLNKPNSTQLAADLVQVLQNAANDGLEPDRYSSHALAEQLPASLALPVDAHSQLALYDTALSLSLLRYLHDLHYGRVNPQGINFNLKPREKKSLDLPALMLAAAQQGNVAQLPSSVEPKRQGYQQLKSALLQYKKLASQTTQLHLSDKAIRPGETMVGLADLKRYLQVSGDMQEEAQDAAETTGLYTDAVVEGVKHFQRRHGLEADGILGKGTIAALNEPLAQRVTQIELAMERLRWLPEASPVRSIVVNIPAFQLSVFDDTGIANPKLANMRVVVGKALKNETPELMADMSFIDFMPYWNVPYNIVKTEILPKLAQNPSYLGREQMEIVTPSGVLPVNSASLSLVKQGSARIRQKPGGKNALGKIKFMFPNKDDVYLHDTPASGLFSRTRRDFSHGCVRVANPQALAEFVLAGQLPPDAIKKALDTPKNQRVILKRPIPVLFYYSTAFFDQQNSLVFYPDIYGRDALLTEALKNNADLPDQALFANAPGQQPTATPPNHNDATPSSSPLDKPLAAAL